MDVPRGTISVVPFKIDDGFKLIADTPALAYLKEWATLDRLTLIGKSPAFTVRDEKGKILACIGVVEHWPTRAEAWAIFDPICRKYFLEIHHAVRRFLKITPIKRVEATVTIGFEEGHRWARLLGFKLEAAILKNYLPDGGAVSLYAKIREEEE